ncbi:26433_t:CDS:2, partial [Dentiscutata erythropus]
LGAHSYITIAELLQRYNVFIKKTRNDEEILEQPIKFTKVNKRESNIRTQPNIIKELSYHQQVADMNNIQSIKTNEKTSELDEGIKEDKYKKKINETSSELNERSDYYTIASNINNSYPKEPGNANTDNKETWYPCNDTIPEDWLGSNNDENL